MIYQIYGTLIVLFVLFYLILGVDALTGTKIKDIATIVYLVPTWILLIGFFPVALTYIWS